MHLIKKIYTKAIQNPITAAIVITLVAAAVLFLLNRPITDTVSNQATSAKAQVTLSTPQDFTGDSEVTLLGNVRAFTQAAVTTQRAGRVVRVNVVLGQSIEAGRVLATLENAAESASVIQAEGAYEAALAAKAQAVAADSRDAVGVDESQNTTLAAQNAAVNSYKSAYTTVNGIILNSIDTFFTSPNGMIPGLRIDGYGQTSYLNSERVAYQDLLANWQRTANTLQPTDDLQAVLAAAETNIDRTVDLVDTFITLFNRSDNGRYTDDQLLTFSTNFITQRTVLLEVKNAIKAAQLGLNSANTAGERATISTSVSSVPAADAQIKQALGALRAAQANYAKTVLRSPISGTINSLNIKAGDFINSFVKVAEVANNDALEIITFISDKQRAVLSVGDSVFIENEYEGRITQISPAIDSATRKTEVRIVTENTDIQNGETVTITKEVAATPTKNTTVTIPLTAVKFEIKDGFIFDVVNGVLVQKPVKLGTIRGDSVEIIDGLSMTDRFVVDARGLLAGSEITITQ